MKLRDCVQSVHESVGSLTLSQVCIQISHVLNPVWSKKGNFLLCGRLILWCCSSVPNTRCLGARPLQMVLSELQLGLWLGHRSMEGPNCQPCGECPGGLSWGHGLRWVCGSGFQFMSHWKWEFSGMERDGPSYFYWPLYLLESIMERFPSGWEAESSGIAQPSPNPGALEPSLKGQLPESPT